MRTCVVSFMLSYFLHVFYDLWVLLLLFIGGNPGNATILNPTVFANRLASNTLFFSAIYWMLSYPTFNKDFPTLRKIHISGNTKLYTVNFAILAYHLILYYFGVLTMDRATGQLIRFYTGYIPMKALWFVAYWSVWNK